jgi:4-hydroxybenzoate polyprenyltransferase
VASANYVINEWLDAPFDKYHPVKKNRPSVVSGLEARYVYMEYALLAVVGLSLAFSISVPFFGMAFFLLVMGFLYNVKPFRTKDRMFLDVISESINNPIRLALGWFIIVPAAPEVLFPPSSMMVAYWMGGAFLMGAKRFAEYRFINDPEVAGLYRKSFKHYNEINLLVSIFFYALTCTFFLGIFLVKHRIELLVSFPMFAFLFSWYLHLAFRKDSTVQRPEKLYKHDKFMAFLVLFTVSLFVLFYVDIPWLHYFLEQTFEF